MDGRLYMREMRQDEQIGTFGPLPSDVTKLGDVERILRYIDAHHQQWTWLTVALITVSFLAGVAVGYWLIR